MCLCVTQKLNETDVPYRTHPQEPHNGSCSTLYTGPVYNIGCLHLVVGIIVRLGNDIHDLPVEWHLLIEAYFYLLVLADVQM